MVKITTFCPEDRHPLEFKDHILLWLPTSASLPGLTSIMEHLMSWCRYVNVCLCHLQVQQINWSDWSQHEPLAGWILNPCCQLYWLDRLLYGIVLGLVLRIAPRPNPVSAIMLVNIRGKHRQTQDTAQEGISTLEKAILTLPLALTHLGSQVLPGLHFTKWEKKSSWNQPRQFKSNNRIS